MTKEVTFNVIALHISVKFDILVSHNLTLVSVLRPFHDNADNNMAVRSIDCIL